MEDHARLATSLCVVPRYQHLVFTEANVQLGIFDLDLLREQIENIRDLNPQTRFVPDISDERLRDYYDVTKIFLRNHGNCLRILTDLSVRFDGKVIMCDDNFLGDITQESIVDIIRGEKRKKFVKERLVRASKQGLPATCSRCCYN